MAEPLFFGALEEVAVEAYPTNALTPEAAKLHELPVKIPAQQQSEWCWLAISLGLAHYYGLSSVPDQCSLAAKRNFYPPGTCCPPGANSACNRPGPLHDCLEKEFDCLGLFLLHPPGPPSLAEIDDELRAGRPVCVQVEWSRNFEQFKKRGRHFLVISGIGPIRGSDATIVILDPWLAARSTMAFSEFVNGYGSARGKWKLSILTRRPRPAMPPGRGPASFGFDKIGPVGAERQSAPIPVEWMGG